MGIARASCWLNDQEHEIGTTEKVQLGIINGLRGKVVSVIVVASDIGSHNSCITPGVQAFSRTRRVALGFSGLLRAYAFLPLVSRSIGMVVVIRGEHELNDRHSVGV
jgi:hypothetical protein